MDAVEIGELVAVVLVLALVVPIVWLIGRQRWLSRLGGTFECGLREPGRPVFMLGVARYNGEYLEWFRSFSLALSPRHRIRQTLWDAGTARQPDPPEALTLATMDTIMPVQRRGQDTTLELALNSASAMGLRAWLESAPAGRGQYGNTAH